MHFAPDVQYSKTGNIHFKSGNIHSKSWNIPFVEVVNLRKAGIIVYSHGGNIHSQRGNIEYVGEPLNGIRIVVL